MKTIYLRAPDRASLLSDLIDIYTEEKVLGVLKPWTAPGITFVEVGLVEASPAVFDGGTLITPPSYVPGFHANLHFLSNTAADDFALLFTPTHGTEIIHTPNNPVSILLSGGETSSSSSVPFTPQKVPESWVSRRAFFLALYEVAAISPDQIRAGLAGNVTALIEFEAPYFDPANPLFLQLASRFGVSEEQLALVWAKARRL